MINFILYKHPEHQLTFSAKDLVELKSDIDPNILFILIEWDVEWSDKVLIAYENNKLIGFFRYDVGNTHPNVYAAGTYVIPEYRNKGLAYCLWEEMFKLEQPKRIYGHIESENGFKLIEKFKKQYKNTTFDFTMSNF